MVAIRATFFQECEEQLAELEAGLLAMEGGNTDPEVVNGVFRAVHSIKGGAGAFALEKLVRFAHVFETAMDEVRAGRVNLEPAQFKVLLRGADVLTDLVRAAQAGTEFDETRSHALAAELAVFARGLAAAGDGEAWGDDPGEYQFEALPVDMDAIGVADQRWAVWFKPHTELYASGNEALLLLRELRRLGPLSVVLDTRALPELNAIDPDGAYLGWAATLTSECAEDAVREVFEFVDSECDLNIRKVTSAADMVAGEASSATVKSGPDDDVMEMLRRTQASIDLEPEPVAPLPASCVAASLVVINPPSPTPPRTSLPASGDSLQKSDTAAMATIRVDLDRVDRLIDLVGELVINEAMLSQRVQEAGFARASGVAMALDELGQMTREIQDSVMAIRAQPVRSVFQRMPRLVREVAAMTGKPVRLVTEGEGTEVDRTVIERLSDPLTHMIRNAIDHGLEAPDDRRSTGKPAEGTVRLSAFHRSGRIVIEVADDGAGLDRTRVMSKAVEKGLIAADARLSDEETDNLIFLPGFSTANAISDLSGRGVGLDVVKRSVQALGGRISIASRPGEGSAFTLSLPLTLAVLDGMVVTVADHTLIVPLASILETLQPKSSEVYGLGEDARVIAIRGGYIPLIDVGAVLGYQSLYAPPDKCVALLVEGEGGTKAVLMVDAIQGQRQVVIKSLEANYRAIPGIAAATVMGDGRVALILDVDVIVSVRRGEATRIDPLRSHPQAATGVAA